MVFLCRGKNPIQSGRLIQSDRRFNRGNSITLMNKLSRPVFLSIRRGRAPTLGRVVFTVLLLLKTRQMKLMLRLVSLNSGTLRGGWWGHLKKLILFLLTWRWNRRRVKSKLLPAKFTVKFCRPLSLRFMVKPLKKPVFLVVMTRVIMLLFRRRRLILVRRPN